MSTLGAYYRASRAEYGDPRIDGEDDDDQVPFKSKTLCRRITKRAGSGYRRYVSTGSRESPDRDNNNDAEPSTFGPGCRGFGPPLTLYLLPIFRTYCTLYVADVLDAEPSEVIAVAATARW